MIFAAAFGSPLTDNPSRHSDSLMGYAWQFARALKCWIRFLAACLRSIGTKL